MKNLLRLFVLAIALILAAAPASSFAKSDNPFELNNATEQELMDRCFFSQEEALRIIEFRDSLGGFQSWDDLKELNLTEAQLSILASEATISGISTDCNC
ncbi:MAG: helix-hairpin-helix domain-containing protein [Desulfovibrionaceae bacterium]|nr:helix-hairpin-helix domain-containing protein [Desulfovibrionaceae bacterium]